MTESPHFPVGNPASPVPTSTPEASPLQSRLEFKLFGNYFQQLLASVPYLEWFVRPPPPDEAAPLAPPTPPKSRW